MLRDNHHWLSFQVEWTFHPSSNYIQEHLLESNFHGKRKELSHESSMSFTCYLRTIPYDHHYHLHVNKRPTVSLTWSLQLARMSQEYGETCEEEDLLPVQLRFIAEMYFMPWDYRTRRTHSTNIHRRSSEDIRPFHTLSVPLGGSILPLNACNRIQAPWLWLC